MKKEDIINPLCSFIDAKCREPKEKMRQMVLIVYVDRLHEPISLPLEAELFSEPFLYDLDLFWRVDSNINPTENRN